MGGRVDIGADELTDRPFVFGDMICDGVRDLRDVEPFILALIDAAEYEIKYSDCDIRNGDINTDGSIDLVDVEPFVDLLLGR